ncbi:heme-binding protein [Umezawaea sp. Da 62-37]|uniref:GlcG/HbpS family heme-binding protein n=1 Tax=Umezawaea sp. Da 62-37 TaxID=3075927 RepID=UPI0028F6DB4F|nr:heme-binding protein [Umezawaea sp. Da 62-37]WNV87061.1 heme-binding protein [Umezawaea sp. Da 62-37]
MPVTLDEAHELIRSAHRRADELGARVTVAVVDEGGHLQALGRMDGAPPLSAEIATHKAASVALVRRDGAELRRMQEAWPAFFTQLDRAAGRPILAGAGSMLIRRADSVLGAVAVSGGLPQHDDDCAEAGLAGLSG